MSDRASRLFGGMRVKQSKLSLRFALAAAAVAAFTMALASSILFVTWAEQFDEYVNERLRSTAKGAASLVAINVQAHGEWNQHVFLGLPRYGIMSGLGLQVMESGGRVLYDDSFATGQANHVAGPPSGVAGPEGQVHLAPIVVDGVPIGVVRVWPLVEEGRFADVDIRFRESSFEALGLAAVIAVIAASIAGAGFAITFLRPIDKITETAEALRAGNQSARTGFTGDDAIGALGKTLDEMADAIEADRNLERRLTADVAHELRTPLQAIQATVEAMQDGIYPADEEHLQIVRNETVRLSRLTDGILELTKLERGSVALRFERIDAAGPVGAAVDFHRFLFEAAGIGLAEQVETGVFVQADSDRLTQAVSNLLSNAIRYSPDGGQVNVAVRREDGSAVIEVADTGIGIAEKDINKVFSRFWRADEARDRESGGLGIGLAIVKEIVKRHGGRVCAIRREGGGTVFRIEIPLIK